MIAVEESVRECYGFAVLCSAHPDAREVLDGFFGPSLAVGPDRPHGSAQTIWLTIDVVDKPNGPAIDPPHTEEVIASNPITIDTGNSVATIEPEQWSVHLTLTRQDAGDQAVWGRLMLERIFLYLVCRSPRHYPLHAGAIAADGRVALLSAPAGTGKSTFTYWCLRSGADLLGEDIMVRHMDDPSNLVWGYSRAVYLAPDIIERCPELDGAVISDIEDGKKCRVRIPEGCASRIRSAARPDCLIFLHRDGEPGSRPLDLDEAIALCRDDFSTGKPDAGVVAGVEADLRGLLAPLPIWSFGLSDDMDANYTAVTSLLRAPQTVG